MTIQERMVARSEREKDLLKYGRSQERERIIKLLEETMCDSKFDSPDNGSCMGYCYNCMFKSELIALIKGEK